MSALIGALLIAMREGVEAALVVSILYAYIVQTGRRDVLPKLWAGVFVGAIIPSLVGAYLTWGAYTLTTQAQEILGGTLSIFAALLVTWMILWMVQNSAEMSKGIKQQAAAKLGRDHGRGWTMFWIALITIGREGLETALFIWPMFLSSQDTKMPALGVILGLIIAIIIGILLYTGTAHLNIKVFFRVTGYFLIFVGGGILAYGFHDLQEAGVIPGINRYLFDISGYFPDSGFFSLNSFWFNLAKAIFQFNPSPTALEFFAWLFYILIVGFLFMWLNHRQDQRLVALGSTNRKPVACVEPSPQEAKTTGDTR